MADVQTLYTFKLQLIRYLIQLQRGLGFDFYNSNIIQIQVPYQLKISSQIRHSIIEQHVSHKLINLNFVVHE